MLSEISSQNWMVKQSTNGFGRRKTTSFNKPKCRNPKKYKPKDRRRPASLKFGITPQCKGCWPDKAARR